MALTFVTETSGNASFFKPADHAADLAMLIEPTRIERDQTNNFGNVVDYVYADLTAFKNAGQLDGSDNPVSQVNVRFESKGLTSELEKHIGAACIFKMGKSNPKPGKKAAHIFLPVDPAIAEQVIAYATKRDEELASEVPDFS